VHALRRFARCHRDDLLLSAHFAVARAARAPLWTHRWFSQEGRTTQGDASDAFEQVAPETVMASASLVRLGCGGDVASDCAPPPNLIGLQFRYFQAGQQELDFGRRVVSPNISSPEQLDVSTPASVVHFLRLGGPPSAQSAFFYFVGKALTESSYAVDLAPTDRKGPFLESEE
jgi:hypothetical protein